MEHLARRGCRCVCRDSASGMSRIRSPACPGKGGGPGRGARLEPGVSEGARSSRGGAGAAWGKQAVLTSEKVKPEHVDCRPSRGRVHASSLGIRPGPGAGLGVQDAVRSRGGPWLAGLKRCGGRRMAGGADAGPDAWEQLGPRGCWQQTITLGEGGAKATEIYSLLFWKPDTRNRGIGGAALPLQVLAEDPALPLAAPAGGWPSLALLDSQMRPRILCLRPQVASVSRCPCSPLIRTPGIGLWSTLRRHNLILLWVLSTKPPGNSC